MVNSPQTHHYQSATKRNSRKPARIRPEDIGLSSAERRKSGEATPPRSPEIFINGTPTHSRTSSPEDISYDSEAMRQGDNTSQKSFLVVPKHSYSVPSEVNYDDDEDDDFEDDLEYVQRCDTGDSRKLDSPHDEKMVKQYVADLEERVSLGSATSRKSISSTKKGTKSGSRSSQSKAGAIGLGNKGSSRASPSRKGGASGARSKLRASSQAMSESLVLVTFVGRKYGVKNISKSLKETFEKAKTVLPKTGELYSICEKYDTYVKGGLYPLLHINKDGAVIGRLEDSDDFLDSTALGEQLVVDQAIYKEVSSIVSPEEVEGTDSVLTIAAFRSVDQSPNEDLLKNWKSWTGARAYMVDIATAGLQCKQMTFFARERPLLGEEDHRGFYYILVCEVMINQPSDEGLIVDVLQRFRVERWFGYQTIYRIHGK